MNLDEIKKNILNSSLSTELKNRLGLILPNLEKFTLVGLMKEVSRGDSALVADDLVQRWEIYSKLLDGLKKGDSTSKRDFFNFFADVSNKLNEDEKLYFLNLVLDVRSLAGGTKINISESEYNTLLNFEISFFWYLPKEEIRFFLEKGLIYLNSRADLLEYFKVVVWENDWDYEADFSKTFSELLFQNKEVFGDKAIGAWIQQYFNFSSPSSFRNDVVQVAEFLVKDPVVQKLNDNEKKTLSEILKLYVWLLKPEINEDEVLEYKEEVRQKEADIIDQMIQEALVQPVVEVSIPPVAPFPKNAPIQKTMTEVVEIPKAKSIEGGAAQVTINDSRLTIHEQVQTDVAGGSIPNNGTFASDRSKVQTIIKKKESNFRPGLNMGDGGGKTINDLRLTINNQDLPSPSLSQDGRGMGTGGITSPNPSSARKGMEAQAPDIDKKLEELEKRVGKKTTIND